VKLALWLPNARTIFAAVVLGLVALACWRAALSTVALAVTTVAAVIVTLALFSTPARIVWSDIFALAFIGALLRPLWSSKSAAATAHRPHNGNQHWSRLEFDVDWTILLSIGGVCISGAAVAFGLIYILPRARRTQPGSADAERYDGLRELCAAIATGGFVFTSLGGVANSARLAAPAVNPALLLGAEAFFVWLCGFWLGRFSPRPRPRVTDIANSQRQWRPTSAWFTDQSPVSLDDAADRQ
jgi:hypothetical protein